MQVFSLDLLWFGFSLATDVQYVRHSGLSDLFHHLSVECLLCKCYTLTDVTGDF